MELKLGEQKSNQMRVLFVSSGNSSGGISTLVESQGESLKQAGVELDFFTINGKGLKGYLRNLPRLKSFLKKNCYDIVHAHYGLCGILAEFSRMDEKLIISFMGDDIIGSHNRKGRFTFKGKIFSHGNRYFAKKHYDFVITKSSDMASKIDREHALSVIPNGVDLNHFYYIEKSEARKALGFPRKDKIIVFAGDPDQSEKNFKMSEDAIELVKECPLRLFPLKNIHFDQVVYYYNAADVTLLTSFHEGSPNAIKEAMACNCPIVSTDAGDVRRIIGNVPGCYITKYDPRDVGEKIKMALEFGNRTRGRDRLIQLGLDSVTIANKIMRVYQQVLERE